jgi:hypothetical protein
MTASHEVRTPLVAALSCALVIACASAVPVAPLCWQAGSAPLSVGVQVRDIRTDPTRWSPASEAPKLAEAIAETKRVVQGDAFKRHLASIAQLYATVPGPAVSGAEVLRALESDEMQIVYERDTSGKDETASTGFGIDAGPQCPSCAVTSIVEEDLGRWAGTEPSGLIHRACLINTLAHEWTHAIPGVDGKERFTDDGHKGSAHPLVSYTVGAVAQCSFLEEQNGLLPAQLFEACVEAVGTRDFFGGDYVGKLLGVCRADFIDRLKRDAPAAPAASCSSPPQ